ncbi:MAG: dephospho-CoA kinase [Tahibacter sp.]
MDGLSDRYVVAATGGIASGKSAVTAAFGQLGVAVFDADVAARAVVERDTPALAEMVHVFGSNILTDGGELDRKCMRARVFGDESARRQLEAIVHPRVNDWLRDQVNRNRGIYCVLAIPLLTETWPTYRWVDRVLVVDVAEEVQLSRLMRRDGIGAELALNMIRAQASRAERAAISDDLIENSGTLADLDVRVAALDLRYREFAANKRIRTTD